MLRQLIVFSAILLSTAATGQVKDNIVPAKAAETKTDYHQPGSPMPALHVATFDTLKRSKRFLRQHEGDSSVPLTKVLHAKDFDNKGNLIVMMFNPTCGHCEDQTDRFEKNTALFVNTRLLLLANLTMKAYLPDFIKNHKINNYPMFTIGMDNGDFIKETFLYQSLPQINIYDKNRKLVRMYNGEVPMDSLKQFID
ncbi:MAG: hypothetical protein H7257_01160 [Taibaiella sp.]|nr:hypothetical protein [Taibaiella sp.]